MAMKHIDVFLKNGSQHTLLKHGGSDRFEIYEDEKGYDGMIKFCEMQGPDIVCIRAYPKSSISYYHARNY